jgi:hypothetical protein
MGLAPAWAGSRGLDDEQRLSFGALDSLVAIMEQTPAPSLGAKLINSWRSGTSIKDLVAAAAYANARRFGGEDYVGFHTMMAMSPAFHMSGELQGPSQILPVIKVLNRNTRRIQEANATAGSPGALLDALRPIEPLCCLPDNTSSADYLRDTVRAKDKPGAEAAFATLAQAGPEVAFNDLLAVVMDNTEVHRVVLPYRAWDLLALIGPENAHTLLRQSLRYCLNSEANFRRSEEFDRPRKVLPKLMDEHHLAGRARGTRSADAAWIDQLARTIFEGTPDAAADAAAAALAEGFEPDAVGQAITLTANQLVLRDAGRPKDQTSPGKPEGSVHGDSIGVHASDSANAWRGMAKVTNARNTFACLILGAYQAAFDRADRGGDFLAWQPLPLQTNLDRIKTQDPAELLKDLDTSVRESLQARATAIVRRYGELGHPARPVFDVLLKYAISEDGALHAEKYYRTVSEEFASTRPAFRWRHLIGLARVTASEYGRPAAGMDEARRLLSL